MSHSRCGQQVASSKAAKREVVGAFSKYCSSAQFGLTEVLKARDHQIIILAEHDTLNEPGPGGLMGPVGLLQES
jgi:hypothetical protein